MSMDYAYALAPFLTWLIAGILKFVVNTIQARRLAFDLIGYGGMPSNHSAIVAGTTMLIAMKESIAHPAFGVAMMVSFVVILDAAGLRGHLGKHARAINELGGEGPLLRERIGHKKIEIIVGIIVGMLTGYGISLF